CRSGCNDNSWLEVVAGARSFVVNLLLRALWVRKYHCSCDCDVYTVSDSHPRCRCAAIFSSLVTCLLFEPRRGGHSLRYNRITDLLWRRLRLAANVVVN